MVPIRTQGKRTFASSASSQDRPRKRNRATGTSAIQQTTEAVNALSSTITVMDRLGAVTSSVIEPSPVQAYRRAEEEEGLSDNGLASVAELFEGNPSAADMYLAFKSKTARRIWLDKKRHL